MEDMDKALAPNASAEAEVKSKILDRIAQEIANQPKDGFEPMMATYYKSGGNPQYVKTK